MESGGITFISSLTSENGGEQRGKEGSGASFSLFLSWKILSFTLYFIFLQITQKTFGF